MNIPYIERAKPENMNHAIVTVLVTYPDMFDSEICVFFNDEYYSRFFDRNSEDQKSTKLESENLLIKLGITSVTDFQETGYYCVMKDEWKGDVSIDESEWWSYRTIHS